MATTTRAMSCATSTSGPFRALRNGNSKGHPRGRRSFRGCSPIADASSPFEVTTPIRTTIDVDENGTFRELMNKAGVKHQVRLATGERGRGLFPTGPTGWGKSSVLLSVPLDVCICAPFGDEAASVEDELEFGTDSNTADIYAILRTAWEKRNGVTIPGDIKQLLNSKESSDRELAVALWVLFAVQAGDEKNNVWRSYKEWLPAPNELPSLLLASKKELDQLQDSDLKKQAKGLVEAVDKFFEKAQRIADENPNETKDAYTYSCDDLKWAFALVASRAVASPVGGTKPSDPHPKFAAILTPFFDMANSDDLSLVSASKSVRGTESQDVENTVRIVLERGLNQGVGGPRVVLETTQGLGNEDAEILISYDQEAGNSELMLRYGFSLRGNRNERLGGGDGSNENTSTEISENNKNQKCRPEVMRAALESLGVMSEAVEPTERRRLFVAVASACGGFGNPDEDSDDWELSVEEVEREISVAKNFRETWSSKLKSFETSLAQDEAVLQAAKSGSLPGATPRVVAAVEYRAERKRVLETAISALGTYVEWLEADEEEESGFEDQE